MLMRYIGGGVGHKFCRANGQTGAAEQYEVSEDEMEEGEVCASTSEI